MTHEEYVAQQRGVAASVALSVLNGELSALEGARTISRLDGLDLDRSEDPDLSVIVLVDEETEALPIGEQRALWAAEAIAAKAPELEHAEQWAREVALEGFARLANRFAANMPLQPTRAAQANEQREPSGSGPRG